MTKRLNSGKRRASSAGSGAHPHSPYPPTNIYESKEGYLVCVELPHYCKKEIKIEVIPNDQDGNNLVISGERDIFEPLGCSCLTEEYPLSMSFTRSYRLARSVDRAQCVAAYVEGILRVALRKAASKAFTINIDD